MVSAVNIPFVSVSQVGPRFLDLQAWLRSAAVAPISSYVYDPSTLCAHRPLQDIMAYSQNLVPEIFAKYYAKPAYATDEMVFTLVRSGIIAGGRAVLCYGDIAEFCAMEGIALSLHDPFRYEDDAVVVERAPHSGGMTFTWTAPPRYIPEAKKFLYVIVGSFNNYGHWHVHNISYLQTLLKFASIMLDRLGLQGIKLVSPFLTDHYLRELKGFTGAMLNGLGDVEVLPLDQLKGGFFAENILFCSTCMLARGGAWARCFGEVLPELRVERDKEAPKKIYINRSHAGRRGIDNEPAFEAVVQALGFVIVRPGQLSFAEQKRVFSNAEVIIGSHGAALTNMIYSQCNPAIIELTHDRYGPVQYNWFRNLAAVMGYRYGPLVSVLTEAQRALDYYNTEFTVAVAEAAGLIEAVVS
jgi:hypothetical protein